MYDIIEAQSIADYQQLQTYNNQTPKVELSEEQTKLFDRLNSQWHAYLEVGLTLLSLSSSCSLICFLRVFGAGVFAVCLGLMALITTISLIVIFWKDLKGSAYKLRLISFLFALSAGLAISLSDAGVDAARHYEAILKGSLIATGVSVIVIGSLSLALKLKD